MNIGKRVLRWGIDTLATLGAGYVVVAALSVLAAMVLYIGWDISFPSAVKEVVARNPDWQFLLFGGAAIIAIIASIRIEPSPKDAPKPEGPFEVKGSPKSDYMLAVALLEINPALATGELRSLVSYMRNLRDSMDATPPSVDHIKAALVGEIEYTSTSGSKAFYQLPPELSYRSMRVDKNELVFEVTLDPLKVEQSN